MNNIITQAQEKFSLLDRVPLGICVLQSDQVVLFWNFCLEEWTKISRDEILGTAISKQFPHFQQPQYANRLQQVFQGGPPTIFSSQLHKHFIPSPLPQGRSRIQHTTVTAVPAWNGDGFYALCSIQDVTDLTFRVQEYRRLRDQALAEAENRRQAQEAAEMASRIKDEFVAIVSHELRAPLNPILGWSKLLKKATLDPSVVDRALETIERNAQTQAQLIDDLLDISRLIRGKLAINLETVDLLSLIEEALETVLLAAEAKSITIELNLDPDIGLVKGDANRLQQVVWNLLSNAIKFTPLGGQVEVELSEVNDDREQIATSKYAQIKISDTGKGISPEFLPHVFEYFRQADSSTTRSVGGLGLGLAIVRQLVELHGGTVTADSPGEGQGATFTVRLPLVGGTSWEEGQRSREDWRDREDRIAPHPLAGVQILIVDDDVDTRDFLAFLLEQHGANVTIAASASEAILAMEHSKADLLLSDLGMPEIDGYSLIRHLRTLSPEKGGQIPAIALTAYAAETTQQKVLAAGFQKYVAKPVDPMELVDAIASLVQ